MKKEEKKKQNKRIENRFDYFRKLRKRLVTILWIN